MNDFSIELACEKVHDSRSKSYLREVVSSYNQGNYRSATVMLWSVVVCDVLFKLDELKNAYGDATATSILKEIQDTQTNNPRSPEWEFELIKKVKERTNLLEEADYNHMEALQRDRHLSAHPILTASYELHAPSKENVRSHLRNALEGLLTKPPIMTKKVFTAFMEDLEAVRDVFLKESELNRYLEAKYFRNMHPKVEDSIFRSLWRLVFRTADERCEKNRDVNFRALRILFLRRREHARSLIQSDVTYYSDVSPQKGIIWYLFRFLSEFPQIFPDLTDAAKSPIQAIAQADFNFAAISWFFTNDLQGHMNKLLPLTKDNQMSGQTYAALYGAAAACGQGKLARKIAIESYAYPSCPSYDRADEVFAALLRPFLKDYEADDLVELLTATEANSQAYGRKRAKEDHALLKARCDTVLGVGFDYTPFPNFVASTRRA